MELDKHTRSTTTQKPELPIYTLPAECVSMIADHLPLRDAKQLRLTSRLMEHRSFKSFARRYFSTLSLDAQRRCELELLDHLRSSEICNAVQHLRLELRPGRAIWPLDSLDLLDRLPRNGALSITCAGSRTP